MKRSQHYSVVLLAAVLAPAMLQITECGGRRSGNTLLTSLELEAGGQNRVVDFVSAQREFDVWVPEGMDTVILRAESFDPGSSISLSYFGVTDLVGVGSGELSVVVPSGLSAMVVLVTAPGGLVRSYLLNVTHDIAPPLCNGGVPYSEVISVACLDGVFADPTVFPFELSVAPSPIQADEPFTAQVSGTAVIDESWMDAVQTVTVGGSTDFWLEDIVATVQVRSGAVGPDIPLEVDLSAITPGPTRFCTLPQGQVCTSDSDCDVPPCLDPINVVEIPTTADQASCTALGKETQFNLNGFCVTGPVEIPLASQTASYTAEVREQRRGGPGWRVRVARGAVLGAHGPGWDSHHRARWPGLHPRGVRHGHAERRRRRRAHPERRRTHPGRRSPLLRNPPACLLGQQRLPERLQLCESYPDELWQRRRMRTRARLMRHNRRPCLRM